MLAVLGGMLGIGVGAAILRAAPALIPPGLLPAAVTPAFDARVVLFGLAAALAVGVVFGVIPAWQATGGSLAGVMASESRSSTSASRRFRGLLVAGEVKRYRFSKQLLHPEIEVLSSAEPEEAEPAEAERAELRSITPDYATPEGVHPRALRRAVQHAVDQYADLLAGHLPALLVDAYTK